MPTLRQTPVDLDRLFHALADKNRREMVERLSAGPASVKELAQPFAMALPSALKHLQILEADGVVVSQKAGRVRTFRLAPGALEAIDRWVAQRKSALNAQFDRLDQYLRDHPDDDANA